VRACWAVQGEEAPGRGFSVRAYLVHSRVHSLFLSRTLTPEQLCQPRGATFLRLRMEAQLYSLRASITRLAMKHSAAPNIRVALVVWAFDFFVREFFTAVPRGPLLTVFRSAICDCC